MFKIRKLSSRDLGQVLEISRKSFKEPWPESEFEKRLKESFVEEDEGKITGFVIGKISNGRGIIKLIAVNPDFREKGVGKTLMEYIFKHFKENGAKEAIARSRLHNKDGCSFLKGLGFEVIKTIKNYYRDGEDAYLMVKKLDD